MKNKNSLSAIISSAIVIAIVAGIGFLFVSPQFEKNKPTIEFKKDIYWNLKDTLKLSLSDDTGIKYYKIIYKNKNNEKVLMTEVLSTPLQKIDLEVKPPKMDMFFKSKEISIVVEAVDNSKWNFFDGNKVQETFNIQIDTKNPVANVITNSLAIRKGGSALAVVEVHDENLKDAYILFNKEQRFELTPFYKEGYFVSLIAWPVTIDKFSRVSLVVIDKANNISRTKIPLFIRKLKVKNDKINISDKFIQNVSASVLEQSSQTVPSDLSEIFIKENRELRAQNVKVLQNISLKYMSKDQISDFKIKPFRRLRGSRTAAGFAERRHYIHNDEKIDEAWHLGLDWASVRNAPIRTYNEGKVIFNEYLGIYGNTIIIDHTMGLSTLYAHASVSKVNLGDNVKYKQVIANTGATGAVLGDHLHFGVLVQGIEVNPLEWMDKNWIKTRITNILKESKKIIDSK
ncbi:M23 family peptidase [Arcobacter sp. HD9-500m-PIT-SAG03]|nr:M23 family peptidase [Arcobacter sp. HD9-500m-PIT-SAG03]